jgi:hypothetical protein
MNLTMLFVMVAEGMPERVLIGDLKDGMTARKLAGRAVAGSEIVRAADADTVVYLDGNGPAPLPAYRVRPCVRAHRGRLGVTSGCPPHLAGRAAMGGSDGTTSHSVEKILILLNEPLVPACGSWR